MGEMPRCAARRSGLERRLSRLRSAPIFAAVLAVGLLATAAGADYTAGSAINGLSAPQSIAIADLNEDGRADLAIGQDLDLAGRGVVAIELANGDGTFSAPTGQAFAGVGLFPVGVFAAGDMNGDGYPDLVTVNSNGNSYSFLAGNGNGIFNVNTYPAGRSPAGGAVADFNGDGLADLAVVNSQSFTSPEGNVSIFLNNGHGPFTGPPGSPITVGNAPVAAVAADLNEDGHIDLAVSNDSGGSVSVLLGNGDGTFTEAPGSPVDIGVNLDGIAAADVNGDGHLDLAVTNPRADELTLLLGNGDGTFSQAAGSPFAVGNEPVAVAAADLNADGNTDLAVANYTSGTVSVLLGDGYGGFSGAPGSPFAVGARPTAVVVTDRNGDGVPDLAVPCFGANAVQFLLGRWPPGAPTGVAAVAGHGEATVSFTAPAYGGGATITGYTVTSSPGGATASGTASPITVRGLTNGTTYTFTVAATNSAGTGVASAASNGVVPRSSGGGGGSAGSPPASTTPSSTTPAATQPAPPPDIQPPSAPAGLKGHFAKGSLLLTWQPSSDNVAVDHYELFFNGAPLERLRGSAATARVRTFEPHRSSVFTLAAIGVAGNESPASASVTVVPRPRPKHVPDPTPRWAWKLFAWQANRVGERPATPRPVPGWYADWRNWRLEPFRLA